MTPIKITTIPVWPATNVRSTQGDRWLFKVSDEYLEEYDNRRIEKKGKVGGNLRRKRQLEKYNAYKEEIRYWSDKNNFTFPIGYFAIWFYVPFPKSWRKKKRLDMLSIPHKNTPDLDNMLKALFDAIMPRRNRISGEVGSDDRKIHCYAAFKIWCYEDDAKIDIIEYSEDDFLSVFSYSSKNKSL